MDTPDQLQKMLDSRALEIAIDVRASTRARLASLEDCVKGMRDINTEQHAQVREALESGLRRVHERINKLAGQIVGRWLLVGGAIILGLLGIVGWLLTYVVENMHQGPS